MKQSLSTWIATLALLGASICYAGSGSASVTTNGARILGSSGAGNAPAYATETVYAQGAYVLREGRVYMALVGGTSGTVTPPATLEDAADGTVTWRAVLPRLRKGLAIVNNDTSAILYVADSPVTAATAKGVRLSANGGAWTVTGSDCPQGPIYAASSTGTVTATTLEW